MSNIYGATSLIGGGSGALDAIDGLNLADGDACQVITDAGVYVYHLNATSSATENSPFRINPNTNPGTKSWHLVGTTARIGALVSLGADQSISNSIDTKISWTIEDYDDAAFWTSGADTRFTIPIGITAVRLFLNIGFDSNADTTIRRIRILKNNGALSSLPFVQIANPNGECILNMSSKIVVVAADYLEGLAYQESGGALNVDGNVVRTWFSIEAVGFA